MKKQGAWKFLDLGLLTTLGIATYVNQKVEDRFFYTVPGNDYTVGIRLNNLIIYNVYKPPSINWSHSMLPTHQYPKVYVGDFNSHSTTWGYTTENEDGEQLCRWATLIICTYSMMSNEVTPWFLADGTQQLLTFVL